MLRNMTLLIGGAIVLVVTASAGCGGGEEGGPNKGGTTSKTTTTKTSGGSGGEGGSGGSGGSEEVGGSGGTPTGTNQDVVYSVPPEKGKCDLDWDIPSCNSEPGDHCEASYNCLPRCCECKDGTSYAASWCIDNVCQTDEVVCAEEATHKQHCPND